MNSNNPFQLLFLHSCQMNPKADLKENKENRNEEFANAINSVVIKIDPKTFVSIMYGVWFQHLNI